MEPFRCIIDKKLRTAFNLKQINPDDFCVVGGKIVAINFEASAAYSKLFLDAVMARKEDVYVFVQRFYRHVMNDERNPMPIFEIT